MAEFKIAKYKIRPEHGKKRPNQPFSVVLLSDLHNKSYGNNNAELLQAIRHAKPEAVFISGDMLTSCDHGAEIDAAVALMDELTKKYPVYYANGNHESRIKNRADGTEVLYEKYKSTIQSFGVHLLENTHKYLEIQGMPIAVWGLELSKEYFRRGMPAQPSVETVRDLLGEPEESYYNILLAHHPSYFEAYAGWGADLTLSGHLHGGIVRLPFLGGVISPQIRLFPKYDRGMFDKNGKKLIVSAGLGAHTINIRINNPAELVIIDFV